MNICIYEICRETIGGVRKLSRHARPRRSSPSCRDEKKREKDDADDMGCACVYGGLGPSRREKGRGERRMAGVTRREQKPICRCDCGSLLRDVWEWEKTMVMDGYESKFITKIVKVIGDKLIRTPLSVESNLIGIQSRVKHINLWLQDGSTDGIVVVYGMSGIGKTTIAKYVYNSNFTSFEGSSFVENIRETASQPNGLVQIQMQLLYDILKGKKEKVHNVSEGISKIEKAISSRRVLLVLDDVDHMDQLNAVLRMKDQFYPWKQNNHNKDPRMEYSKELVQQSGGLPLALQVLGSSLLGESMDVWTSALEKLKVIPNDEIMKKLRISYDSLQDDHDRKLFLHIACFLKERDKNYIVRILDGCDFFTTVGIQNLIDRCLVKIDKDNKVNMHNLIRDMGRDIVPLESGKRSRLWWHKDSF
nr:TMV resistance protein N-like [Malus domestica]